MEYAPKPSQACIMLKAKGPLKGPVTAKIETTYLEKLLKANDAGKDERKV